MTKMVKLKRNDTITVHSQFADEIETIREVKDNHNIDCIFYQSKNYLAFPFYKKISTIIDLKNASMGEK